MEAKVSLCSEVLDETWSRMKIDRLTNYLLEDILSSREGQERRTDLQSLIIRLFLFRHLLLDLLVSRSLMLMLTRSRRPRFPRTEFELPKESLPHRSRDRGGCVKGKVFVVGGGVRDEGFGVLEIVGLV